MSVQLTFSSELPVMSCCCFTGSAKGLQPSTLFDYFPNVDFKGGKTSGRFLQELSVAHLFLKFE